MDKGKNTQTMVHVVLGFDVKTKKPINKELLVVTTNKRLTIWYNNKIVAEAGVKFERDFDWQALFDIALHCNADNLMSA